MSQERVGEGHRLVHNFVPSATYDRCHECTLGRGALVQGELLHTDRWVSAQGYPILHEFVGSVSLGPSHDCAACGHPRDYRVRDVGMHSVDISRHVFVSRAGTSLCVTCGYDWDAVFNGRRIHIGEEPARANDPVTPSHYHGDYVMRVIEDFALVNDFCLGQVVKYVLRAGKKEGEAFETDLRKAQWYLNRRLENVNKKGKGDGTE